MSKDTEKQIEKDLAEFKKQLEKQQKLLAEMKKLKADQQKVKGLMDTFINITKSQQEAQKKAMKYLMD